MKKILIAIIFLSIFINTSCSSVLSPKEFKYSDLVGSWKVKDYTAHPTGMFYVDADGMITPGVFGGKIDNFSPDKTTTSATVTMRFGYSDFTCKFTSATSAIVTYFGKEYTAEKVD